MTSIMLKVTGAQAWASVSGPLTSGMVGIPVTIEYDDSWDGLTKNLVCRCSEWGSDSGEHRAILNVENTAVVAHEVMKAGMYLHLGIEGISSDGELVMPTTWAMCGEIQNGANTGEDLSADPTLPIWNQLQAEIAQIKENTFTEEEADEIRACAQSAVQAAAIAERSKANAVAASNLAASDANAAEEAAETALESMENARTSAASAANLANEALRRQREAEAAAERAEEAAESVRKLSPVAKTEDMTQPVGVDEDGLLWTAPTADDAGGGNGSGDYTDLTGKPSINGVELVGNKTSAELGIGQPSDEQVGAAMGDWLEEHPEATTIVADRSITAEKTTFITPEADNLIDMSRVVKGYQGTSGVPAGGSLPNTSTGCTTDYIEVEAGSTYNSVGGHGKSGIWASWYYDADKNPVSIVDGNPFTVPDGVRYVRLTFSNNADISTLRLGLYRGVNPMVYTQGVQRYGLDELLTSAVKTVHDANSVFKVTAKNLYKLAAEGSMDGTTGIFTLSGGSLNISDYIEITPGIYYISNCFAAPNYSACYDKHREYVSGFSDAIEWGPFVTHDGGTYKVFKITNPDVRYIVNGSPKNLDTPIKTPFIVRGNAMPDSLDGIDISTESVTFVEAAKKLLGITGNDLAGKTWAVLGDSTTAGSGNAKTYHSIIAEEEGLTAINYGVNGSWVSYNEGMAGQEMCTRFETMTDDADIITVMGGINDTNNGAALGEMGDTGKDTFYGALDILCRGLHRKYPGKRIGYITPMNYGNDAKAEPYLEAIHKVCGKYAIPVLDMYHNGLICAANEELSGIYFRDGLHQNDFGHGVQARKVKAFLRTL